MSGWCWASIYENLGRGGFSSYLRGPQMMDSIKGEDVESKGFYRRTLSLSNIKLRRMLGGPDTYANLLVGFHHTSNDIQTTYQVLSTSPPRSGPYLLPISLLLWIERNSSALFSLWLPLPPPARRLHQQLVTHLSLTSFRSLLKRCVLSDPLTKNSASYPCFFTTSCDLISFVALTL